MAQREMTIDELLIDLYEEDFRFRALVRRSLKSVRRRKIPPVTDSVNAPKYIQAVQDSLWKMLYGESSRLQIHEDVSPVVAAVFEAAIQGSTLLGFALHVIAEEAPEYDELAR